VSAQEVPSAGPRVAQPPRPRIARVGDPRPAAGQRHASGARSGWHPTSVCGTAFQVLPEGTAGATLGADGTRAAPHPPPEPPRPCPTPPGRPRPAPSCPSASARRLPAAAARSTGGSDAGCALAIVGRGVAAQPADDCRVPRGVVDLRRPWSRLELSRGHSCPAYAPRLPGRAPIRTIRLRRPATAGRSPACALPGLPTPGGVCWRPGRDRGIVGVLGRSPRRPSGNRRGGRRGDPPPERSPRSRGAAAGTARAPGPAGGES
jgi:hypothetical protein